MLNKSDECEDPYPIPLLRGNAFSFSQLRMMLGGGFSYVAFIKLWYISFIPTFWRVSITNGY